MVALSELNDSSNPDFPTDIGEQGAVTFIKDGHEYRMLRAEEDLWTIDQVGLPEEDFHLDISNVTDLYIDVTGRNQSGPVHALATSRCELFAKLF